VPKKAVAKTVQNPLKYKYLKLEASTYKLPATS